MAQIETDKIEFKSGAYAQDLGCMIPLGILLVILGAVAEFVFRRDWEPQVIGWVFIVVGLHVALYRRAITIDRGRHIVRIKRGYFVPWRSREEPVDLFESVRIDRHYGGEEGAKSYTVSLSGETKDIHLYTSGGRNTAKDCAEQVSVFLNIALVDKSRGEEVVRKPEDFDKSYLSRTRVKTKAATLPDPPTDAASKIAMDPQGDMLFIKFPRVGFRFGLLIRIVFGVIGVLFMLGLMAFFIYGSLNSRDPTPLQYYVLIIGVPMLIGGLAGWDLVLGSYWTATRTDRLEVSPHRTDLVTFWPSSKEKRTSFSPEAISDIRIIGRSDTDGTEGVGFGEKMLEVELTEKSLYQFGRGLSVKELEWIRDVIRYVIAKRS